MEFNWQPELLKRSNPPLGLNNCGNTCYLNSVIQCLTYTPPLANYCIQRQHSRICGSVQEEGNSCPFCILEDRIYKSHSLELEFDTPKRIIDSLNVFATNYILGEQRDAHEFLSYAIDKCEAASLHLKQQICPNGIINEIFGGVTKSQVNCPSCGYESNTVDGMYGISVEILNLKSLKQALQKHFQPEILDKKNKYKCPSCQRSVKASKKLSVLQAPNILVIQLKKFANGIDKKVAFEETLDLGSFMCDKSQDPHPHYKLFASIVHIGISPDSGHYYAYVKDAYGKWYNCNDSHVSPSTLKTVLNDDAYILFYSRTTQRPSILPKPTREIRTNDLENIDPNSTLSHSKKAYHPSGRNPRLPLSPERPPPVLDSNGPPLSEPSRSASSFFVSPIQPLARNLHALTICNALTASETIIIQNLHNRATIFRENFQPRQSLSSLGIANKYLQVEDLTPEEVLAKLQSLGGLFRTGQPFPLPSHAPTNIHYLPSVSRVHLGRKSRRVYTKWEILADQLLFVMGIVYLILLSNLRINMRNVYYTGKPLFVDKAESDDVIRTLGCLLGCTRASLNLDADTKGLVLGHFQVYIQKKLLDCTNAGTEGLNIPPHLLEVGNMINQGAYFILLVEKQTIYKRLIQARFYNQRPCIIIHGHGQPDIGTRGFLSSMQRQLKLPIYALMDCDPHGIQIMYVYRFGSDNMAHDSWNLASPNIRWLGIRPTDCVSTVYDVPNEAKHDLTPKERGVLRAIKGKLKNLHCQEWIVELKLMKKLGWKIGLEGLDLRGFQHLIRYLLQKIDDNDCI